MSRRAKEHPNDPIRQVWYDWRTQSGLHLSADRTIHFSGLTFVVDGESRTVRCGDTVVETSEGLA